LMSGGSVAPHVVSVARRAHRSLGDEAVLASTKPKFHFG